MRKIYVKPTTEVLEIQAQRAMLQTSAKPKWYNLPGGPQQF